MSEARSAVTATGNRLGSGAGRLLGAWRTLPPDRRLAVYASLGLFFSMFLPWYQRQFFIVLAGKIPQPVSDSQTAWGAFSFVEAAVLLTGAGVITLLFQRAEGKAFHLPGGDGGVITAAGVWTSILVIWRIFDKQGGNAHGQNATTYGIEWGIFIALAIAILLAYAGSRIRSAHRPEPPLPGEEDDVGGPTLAAPAPVAPVVRGEVLPAAEAETQVRSDRLRRRPSSRPTSPERPVGWLSAQSEPVEDTEATLPKRESATLPRPESATLPKPESATLPKPESATLPKREA